jgi:hypothetical protein
MVIRRNIIYGHQLRVGRSASQIVEENIVVRGEFSAPAPEKNTLIPIPATETPPILRLRPNRYDPRRANLLVSNWDRADRIEADLSSFLRTGDRYRVLSPLDFYGRPLTEGTYDGKPVSLPLPTIPWALMTGDPKELGVYIVLRSTETR